MADEDVGETMGKMGVMGAKFGAKMGKKAAQSEAGRAAGRAAVKGAANEMSDRYFGPSEPQTPAPTPTASATPKETTKEKKTSLTKPPAPSQSETRESSGATVPREQSQGGFGDKFKSKVGHYNWKISNEHKYTGPTQTRESAEKHAQERLRRNRVKTSLLRADWDKVPMCEALYHYKSEQSCDLEFRKGQRIAILTRTESQNDWWEGTVNEKTGIFPANYVKML